MRAHSTSPTRGRDRGATHIYAVCADAMQCRFSFRWKSNDAFIIFVCHVFDANWPIGRCIRNINVCGASTVHTHITHKPIRCDASHGSSNIFAFDASLLSLQSRFLVTLVMLVSAPRRLYAVAIKWVDKISSLFDVSLCDGDCVATVALAYR